MVQGHGPRPLRPRRICAKRFRTDRAASGVIASSGRDTARDSAAPRPCYRRASEQATAMNFDDFFKSRVDALHAEGRYRVFADLERRCGDFPRAFDHRIGAEVTVWCSNDYLGMGQHPVVIAAMTAALDAV